MVILREWVGDGCADGAIIRSHSEDSATIVFKCSDNFRNPIIYIKETEISRNMNFVSKKLYLQPSGNWNINYFY